MALLKLINNGAGNKWWCTNCEFEAKSLCFDAHALRPLRRLQKEEEAALADVRGRLAAVLRRLSEDVAREERLLSAGVAGRGLAAVREALATARTHPLHLLAGEERPLQCALQALRERAVLSKERAALAEEKAAVKKDEERVEDYKRILQEVSCDLDSQKAALGEREAALRAREAALQEEEASFHERLGVLQAPGAVPAEGDVYQDEEASSDRETSRRAAGEAGIKCEERHEASAADSPAAVSDGGGDSGSESIGDGGGGVSGDAAALGEHHDQHDQGDQGQEEDPVDQDLAAGPSQGADEPCGMDSLGDELLAMILARVPASESASAPDGPLWLLSLRRVCKRWGRLLLEKRMWQHRRLELDHPRAAALLYVLPALHSLTLRALVPHVAFGKPMLEALANGICQVRSLTCEFFVTISCSKQFLLVLDRQPGLEELTLNMALHNRGSNPTTVLSAVDTKGLRRLTLRAETLALGHEFHWLRSLQELRLEGGRQVCGRLVRSALQSGSQGGALHTVRCSGMVASGVALEALAQLQRREGLRCLEVRAAEELAGLRRAPCAVRELHVHCGSAAEVKRVRALLSPGADGCRVAKQVRLSVRSLDAAVALCSEAASLHAVTHLDLRPVDVCKVTRMAALASSSFSLLGCFSAMPDLRYLFMEVPDGESFLDQWEESTAPRLLVLHVNKPAGSDGSEQRGHSWAERVRRVQPTLTICHPRCTDSHS